jgi:hypothetical protein
MKTAARRLAHPFLAGGERDDSVSAVSASRPREGPLEHRELAPSPVHRHCSYGTPPRCQVIIDGTYCFHEWMIPTLTPVHSYDHTHSRRSLPPGYLERDPGNDTRNPSPSLNSRTEVLHSRSP